MIANRGHRAAWALLVVTSITASRAWAETITWTGEGDATSWHDADNWDLVREPADGDDVVIPDVAATTEVIYSSGTTSIQTLSSDEAMRLTGGTLGIDASSQVNADFTQTNGTLTGAGEITVTGLLMWTDGVMDGSGITNANGGLTVNGAVLLRGDGDPLTPDRVLNHTSDVPGAMFTGLAELDMSNNTVFNNTGTVYIEADGQSVIDKFLSGNPRCINSGTLIKSAGPGTATIDVDFENSGTVDVRFGELKLHRGGINTGNFNTEDGTILAVTAGTYTVTDGSTGSGAGTVEVRGGRLDAEGNASLHNLTLNGTSAYLGGAGVFTVTGLLMWTDGVMDGSGITNANGGLTVNGAVLLRGDGDPLTPDRVLNHTSDVPGAMFTGLAELDMSNNTVFNNTGTVYIEADGQSVIDKFLSGNPRCINSGTLIKSAGPATATIDVDFENSGVVEVNDGTLSLTRGFTNFDGSTLTGGTYIIGGTLQFDDANLVSNAAKIVLDGANSQIIDQSGNDALLPFDLNAVGGEFTLRHGRELTTTGPLVNEGIFSVEAGSRLAVADDYTQTGSGTLEIQIDAGAGGGHGDVTALGTAVLDGSLEVSLAGGSYPGGSQSFFILSATAVNGTFAAESLPALPSEPSWSVRYEPDSVVVDFLPPPCEEEGDPDGDGIWNCDDVCPLTYAPGGVDAEGRPLGDLDIDCDVDLDDYALFAACLTAPGVSSPPLGCTSQEFDAADFDDDADVDFFDFSVFQLQFGSPMPTTLLPILLVQPGDSWTYDDQQSGTSNGVPVTGVGTTTLSILPQTVTDFAGNTAYVLSGTFEGLLNGDTPVTTTAQNFVSQDSDGTYYIHGELNVTADPPVDRFIQSPAEGKIRTIASPPAIGATNQAYVVYDDGATQIGGNAIVRIERVATPVGSLLVAKIVGSQILVDGMTVRSLNVTSWFAPQLGMGVKMVIDLAYRDKTDETEIIIHSVRELTETNVAR